MGQEVVSAAIGETKPQFLTAAVIAASYAPAAAELSLFVGDTGLVQEVEAYNTLRILHDAYIEDSAPVPTGVQFVTYQMPIGAARSAITKTLDAVVPAQAETDASVSISLGWIVSAGRSEIFTGHFLRMIEKYQEATKG